MKTQFKTLIAVIVFVCFVCSVVLLGQASRKERNAMPVKVQRGQSAVKDSIRRDWQKVKYWVDKKDRETDWLTE